MPEEIMDWSFVGKRHKLGEVQKDTRDPKEVLKIETKRALRLAAREAALPKRFWEDTYWSKLEPEPILITDPVNGSRTINISAKTQSRWLRRMLLEEDFRKRGCIIIFGDYLAEAAERVAFGVISQALQKGVSARVFHPLDLVKGPPTDFEGKEKKYQIVCLNRIHTDDEGPRRTLVRDFVNKYYEKSFKIVVIYGDDPVNFFYRKIGLSPNALFLFPYQGQLVRTIKGKQEH